MKELKENEQSNIKLNAHCRWIWT